MGGKCVPHVTATRAALPKHSWGGSEITFGTGNSHDTTLLAQHPQSEVQGANATSGSSYDTRSSLYRLTRQGLKFLAQGSSPLKWAEFSRLQKAFAVSRGINPSANEVSTTFLTKFQVAKSIIFFPISSHTASQACG